MGLIERIESLEQEGAPSQRVIVCVPKPGGDDCPRRAEIADLEAQGFKVRAVCVLLMGESCQHFGPSVDR